MRTKLQALQWTTILVLLAALGAQYQTRSFNDDARNTLAGMVERQVKGEAWLGTQIPEFATRSRVEDGGFHLYWIVDLDQCHDCTSDIENWNTFAVESGGAASVLLSAADAEAAHRFAGRFHNAESVRIVDPGFMRDQFGFDFPSFRFVSDGGGTIISVDSRIPNSQCRWSYVAHVAAMTQSHSVLPFRIPRTDGLGS